MRIGRIFGIEIFVNVSWLFVFGIVAWSLASNVGPLHAIALQPWARALLALVTATLFFASVLGHELAHSLVARARGLPIRGIRLFIFGGVSMLEAEPPSAPSELWVAVIGPLVSIALGLLFTGLSLVLGGSSAHTGALADWRDAIAVALGYLGVVNIALAAFNVLPAYPLDGGRVLHAVVWRVSGKRVTATRVAVFCSRLISGALIVGGIIWTIADGLGGGLWLTFIGWFLLQAAGLELVSSRISEALGGHLAAELAADPEVRIAADQSAQAALQALLTKQVHSAPVFVGDRFIGVISLQDLVRVAEPASTYVTACMTGVRDLRTIDASSPATDVTRLLAQGGHPLLPVVDDHDEVIGFVTRESMLRWMAAHAPTASDDPPSPVPT